MPRTSNLARYALMGAFVGALVVPASSASATSPYLEPEFGDDGVATLSLPPARDVQIAPSGRIVFTLTRGDDIGSPDVAALTPAGEIDEDFGDGGTLFLDPGSTYSMADLAIDGDGFIFVLAGSGVWKLDPDGDPVESFGDDGFADLSEFGLGVVIALRADGRILVGGSDGAQKIEVTQLLADGSIDRGFGTNGLGTAAIAPSSSTGPRATALELAVSPDGGIVVGAQALNYMADAPYSLVAKLIEDGAPDTAFSPSLSTPGMAQPLGSRGAAGLAVLEGGQIVFAGSSHPSSVAGPNYWFVRQLTAGGEPDSAFSQNSGMSIPVGHTDGRNYHGERSPVADIVRLDDGRYVVVGGWNDLTTAGEESWAAGMLTSDGDLVDAYGTGGVVEDRSDVHWIPASAALDSDGTIVMAGSDGGVATLGRLLTTPQEAPPSDPSPSSGGVVGDVSADPRLEILSSRIPRRLSQLAAKGVVVRARCAADCRMFIRIVIPRRQARQLGVPRVIAGAEADATGGQVVRLVSKLSATAKLRLLAQDPKVLQVRVQGTADPR